MSLATGLALLKQQQYDAAIPVLEAVCQPESEASSGDRIRATMGLVQAYGATQQTKTAIALCRTLLDSPYPKVKTWARQRWRVLQRQGEQDSTPDFANLLPQAHDAIARQDWSDAIQLLEPILDPATPSPDDLAPYQLLLIEAYVGNQDIAAALNLCDALQGNPDPVVQAWIKQTRKQLDPPRKPTAFHPVPRTQSRPRSAPQPVTRFWQWGLLGICGVMLWFLWGELKLTQQVSRLLPTPPPDPSEVLTSPVLGGLNTATTDPTFYAVTVPDQVVNQAIQRLNRNQPPSAVKLNESEQFYDIQGSTAYQLWDGIRNQAQFIITSGGEGSHAIASAALKPRWNFTTHRTSTHCWISKVAIEMDVLYTYPRWSNASVGNAQLRNAWEQYRRFLIRHEQTHTQIALDALSGIEAAILQLGARPDCPTIVQEARAIALQRWEASSEAQTRFDETEDDPDQFILRSLAVQERYREQEAWWRGF